MDEYKPNSHKSREQSEERTKAAKVVTGKAKQVKKTEVKKFADAFISDDVNSIKSYIMEDVVGPAIKKTVSDMIGGIFNIIKDSIDKRLYGEEAVAAMRKNRDKNRASYTGYYDKDKRYDRDDRRRVAAKTASNFEYDDIVFETRADAVAVLNKMDDMMETYDAVSVADLYDMADLTIPYTGNRYGWTDIRHASVLRGRDGYVIKLPRPKAL